MWKACWFMIGVLAFVAPVLSADINSTIIEDRVMQSARGIVGVNISAGDAVAQANLWAIGVGVPGRLFLKQSMCNEVNEPLVSENLIQGLVLAGAQGIFGINQAAGNNLSEANLVNISLGVPVEKAGISLLAQTAGQINPSRNTLRRGRWSRDVIGEGVLQGAQGVFQINQSAGSVNALSNTFSLNLIRDVGASGPTK